MCGICGVFRSDRKDVIDREQVLKMRDIMRVRGPDAAGLSVERGCILGHRRLAIIDLSDDGIQPMHNSEKTLEIVFNGEIYNYRLLRHQLQESGHNFSTQTDTEVLLHGYQAWGLSGLLQRIRGMYAFALVDYEDWCIHLVRDPSGQKPLFYHWANNTLRFASLAGVLVENVALPLNLNVIDDLTHNLVISGKHSIFEDVHKVQPGHVLSINASGQLESKAYWQPDFFQPIKHVDDSIWLKKVEDALTVAVERRLVADVPLGVLVSGGIDSSLVAAIAQKITGGIKTFSVATEDAEFDESQYSRAVAEHLGTQHFELKVKSDARAGILPMIAAMAEPFTDASAINLYQIARLAREQVTVVLTGDGGDEGFGGYHRHMRYHYADKIQRFIPLFLNPMIAKLGTALQQRSGHIGGFGTVLGLASLPISTTLTWNNWLNATTRDALYTSDLKEALNGYDALDNFNYQLDNQCNKKVDEAMQIHFQTTLPDDYLAKIDYTTMAVSLEARSPFLDRDLLNLAFTIPAEVRFRNNQSKSILRRLAYQYLPREVIDRPKKGFVTPVWLWFANEWQNIVYDFILGENVERRGWFKRDTLTSIFERHKLNPTYHTGYLLWTLLVLELWVQMHVEHTISESDTL